jgi:hypothetical protein
LTGFNPSEAPSSGIFQRPEVDVENRLNVFAECFLSYNRSGDIETSYNQIFMATGAYFRIGVFRNFDFFGESPYIHSENAIKGMKKNRAFTGISFLNPTFNWLTDKKGNYASKDVKLGWNLAFEKDIKLFPNINFMTGAIVTINSGGKSYNLPDAKVYQMEFMTSDGTERSNSINVLATGVVTVDVSYGTLGTVNSDTDAKVCVYDGGTLAVLKNRTGAPKTFFITLTGDL